MACSQLHCCVLLQTIIELTVHFSSGGWNIKFDLILALMLLHFANLTVLLDDRGICDHSTMTWEPQLWQEIALVMGLERVLQNITQCRSGKMGQTDRTQTHEWQVTLNSLSHWKCCGLRCLSCNFPIKIMPLLDFDEFLTRGKHNTDNENDNMCLFCSSVKLEVGDYIKTFAAIGFQIFF